MKLANIPQKIKQPSGEILDCYASGDEYFNWLHDKDGYIIIQDDKTGYYSYAKYVNGNLVPSTNIITKATINNVANLNFSKEAVKIEDIKISYEKLKARKIIYHEITNPAPKEGAINNLVVFIRFSDDPTFANLISAYNDMFNTTTPNYNSMYNYFKETSYNSLFVSSTFYPSPIGTTVVSYVDAHPRAYYEPYNVITNPIGYDNTNRTDREHTLLQNAVNFVSSQVSQSLNIDEDNDGNVDSVCFIVKGSPEGWNDLLWPHQWELYTKNVFINGKRVLVYDFQLDDYLFNLSVGVGVLCHEMSHTIGYPDLYHYSQDGFSPVSFWDVMENTTNPPQYSGAYMKYRYGTWIKDIPEITAPGNYTLYPLTSPTNNCYKIQSPLSTTEYFVLEYRKRTSPFEITLPGSGLLVYRINTAVDGKGNADGPPDEVYVFRPDGTTTTNGNPLNAYLSSDVDRTSIGGPNNPIFFSDGTDSGITITNIGSAGDTISFDVAFGTVTSADISLTKTATPTTIDLGENLKYALTVKNDGPDSAVNVIATDELPDNVDYVSAESSKGTCSYSNGIVTCNIGDMSNGDSVTITINVKPIAIGEITNTASVTSNIFDPDYLNNTATVITTVTPAILVTRTLSTGPIVKDHDAQSLVVIAENTTSNQITMDVFIYDLGISREEVRHKTITINPYHTEEFISKKLPLNYEIVFDNVPEGIYCWTAARREDSHKPLKHSNFIASSTFKYADLIDLTK